MGNTSDFLLFLREIEECSFEKPIRESSDFIVVDGVVELADESSDENSSSEVDFILGETELNLIGKLCDSRDKDVYKKLKTLLKSNEDFLEWTRDGWDKPRRFFEDFDEFFEKDNKDDSSVSENESSSTESELDFNSNSESDDDGMDLMPAQFFENPSKKKKWTDLCRNEYRCKQKFKAITHTCKKKLRAIVDQKRKLVQSVPNLTKRKKPCK